MNRGNHITGLLAVTALLALTINPVPCTAQKTTPRPAPPPAAVPTPQQHVSHPPDVPGQEARSGPQQQRHVGDWLREYKDLAPAEQEQALQNDPDFKQLPLARQEKLRERLQHFSTLTPQRQLQILNRMDTFAHLTREQKQEAWRIFREMRQLPPDRHRKVHAAIDDLRTMPPDQRDNVINSDRFKGMFSDQERQLMRDAARLPLAPSDSGDQPGQPQPEQPQD